MRQQFAVSNVSEPVTSLRLVHVMGRDQNRQPLACETMNLIPEIATRFWIDARCRLVKQEQVRFVNETRGQCEALFPSAGELACELTFPSGKAELLETLAHGLSPIVHVIDLRDEIEILRNAQVFPKTESLRHVTDFALNRFALGNHVMTETSAVSIISSKQSAKHPQERCLAAAVGTEESEDLALAHG